MMNTLSMGAMSGLKKILGMPLLTACMAICQAIIWSMMQ